MKKMFMNRKAQILTLLVIFFVASCTRLEQDVRDPLFLNPTTPGGAPSPSSLDKVYEQLNQLNGQGNSYAMQEHTTDEFMGPTRGTDWDDFGTWRKLHLHTWDGAHNQINDTWNGLNGALFQTTLLAELAGPNQPAGRFLRAYFTYIACDLFGQVQHRPATATIDVLPDVFTRAEAVDFIISELEAVIPTLPAFSPTTRNLATKAAAQFLLAKTYLNKAVYKQDPESPAGPFTFAAADMNKVIELCNAIKSENPSLVINDYYWDNFTWENGTKSTENIFVRHNGSHPIAGNGVDKVWATCQGWHYNQTPSSWNGFTTLVDFYNSFENADVRKKSDVPGYTSLVGAPAGFLVGQIRGPSKNVAGERKIGNPLEDLQDRSGNPLIFTPDVSLFFSTETKGIRTNKFPLNPAEINGGGWSSGNEFPYFRFADVRLMKAEAIFRGGTDPLAETPLAIVDGLRAKRGVGTIGSVTAVTLLAERGRELYLEAWRRNDLIRFGKFNDPVGERPNASTPNRVVFPIPNIALSSNPNLKQNPGY